MEIDEEDDYFVLNRKTVGRKRRRGEVDDDEIQEDPMQSTRKRRKYERSRPRSFTVCDNISYIYQLHIKYIYIYCPSSYIYIE